MAVSLPWSRDSEQGRGYTAGMIKRLAFATFLLCILGACGNKGPLVMPDAPAEVPGAPVEAPDAPVEAPVVPAETPVPPAGTDTPAPAPIPEGASGTPVAHR